MLNFHVLGPKDDALRLVINVFKRVVQLLLRTLVAGELLFDLVQRRIFIAFFEVVYRNIILRGDARNITDVSQAFCLDQVILVKGLHLVGACS